MEKISKSHSFYFRNLRQEIIGTLKKYMQCVLFISELLRQKENEIRLINSKLHSIGSNKEI